MSAQLCASCGYVHTSSDARALGRFTDTPTYVAAHAGTPPRATRAEAEADECAWRRQTPKAPAVTIPQGEPVSRDVAAGPQPEPEPFPAATIETAARAKAWADFLTQVRLSLLVWQIDGEVREGCEHVLVWLRGCLNDLAVSR